MKRTAFYIVNAITLYRITAALYLSWLLYTGDIQTFKWMLGISFFTDLIDGPIARKYKVTSRMGAYLDSIGDDLTILAGIAGTFIFKPEFLYREKVIILILVVLFFLQIIIALYRYGRISSFHTVLAKVAAILQGSFLILLFFLPEPVYPLFYAASLITLLDLIEEIILVILLEKCEANVKGVYWILKARRGRDGSSNNQHH